VGSTGSGKSVWSLSLLQQLEERDCPVVILDFKGDLSKMVTANAVHAIAKTGEPKSIRTIDPFSKDFLLPWNILAREDSVDVDVQAFEIANLIVGTTQAEVGIRQSRLLHSVIALTIELGGTLVDAHRALTTFPFLHHQISESSNPRIRQYFAVEFQQEAQVTKAGVITRIESLLRLPTWRKMFGTQRKLDFNQFLEKGITIIDIGNAPLGCHDLQRFIGRLIFLRIARAVTNRPVMDDLPHAFIFIDEVQEFLSAGMADELERLLTLARSRKVAFALFHQQIAQLEKVSRSLPKIIATNCNLKAIFRTGIEDAHKQSHIFPVTGNVLRKDYRPDTSRDKSPYLTESEERKLLAEKVARFPSRQFYFHRTEAGHTELLRSVEVPISKWMAAPKQFPDIHKRILQGNLMVPIYEIDEPFKTELNATEPSEDTSPIHPDFEGIG